MSSLRIQKNHKGIPAKPLIIGALCGAMSCAALIFLAAFLITKNGNMPDNLIEPLMLVLTCIGAFIGGYISGKISHKKGMLHGIACGFVMFVLFFLGSFAISRGPVTMTTVIKLLGMILAGAVGGTTGVNKS